MNNLSKGQPDGDRGRSLGGKARVKKLARLPVDDSGRSHAQYWGQLGWFRLIEKHGRKEASHIMSQRGVASFSKQYESYSRYLGELREAS